MIVRFGPVEELPPHAAMTIQRILIAAVLVGLAACSNVPRIVTEYRIDVQQGNVLTQEMVSQLKPGQTRDQVRFLLGTPLLADIFHADRWDYVYRLENGRTSAVEIRKFSVFFNADGRLEKVSGDVEVAQVAELTAPVASTQVIDLGSLPTDAEGKPLPPADEKGFFGRMLEKVGL
jgi:outer membrane protein assembly factor BamE